MLGLSHISPQTFGSLEEIEAKWLGIERSQDPDPDVWRWSPLPLPKFVEMMAIATMARSIVELGRRPTFFEPGCGVGTKLYVAQEEFDLEASGWELFPEYVEQCGELGVKAEVHDLRAEEPDWASFDIIYTSRPFKDDDYERRWEARVQERMRPGAVLIQAFAGVKPYAWQPWLFAAPWRVVSVKP